MGEYMKTISMWHNGIKITDSIQKADRFFQRLVGLMGRADLGTDGLVIKPCRQIHTYFMRFPIDVLFLSENGNVVYIEKEMTPGKIGRYVKQAQMVVETAAGFTDLHGIKAGDIVLFEANREEAE